MSIGVLLLYLIVGLSLDSIRRQVNKQAETESIRQIVQNINSLQDQVRQFTRDYNNWGDVYSALINYNIDFVSDNYGITAVNGDMFDGAVIYHGVLDKPLAWRVNGTRAPQNPSLSTGDLEKIRVGVDQLPEKGRATFDFAILNDNMIQLGSASRILPDTAEALSSVNPSEPSIGIILRTITNEQISNIERKSNVNKLRISQEINQFETNVPLNGVDGTAIAHFQWLASRPGNELLRLISPIIGAIFLIIGGLGFYGTRLFYNFADALALREKEASHLARSDTLTGLPNRLALREHGDYLDARKNERYAVILFDINNFKRVNDLAGHQGGDELIRDFAKNLRGAAKEEVFISRVGGDEFVAVVSASSDITEVAHQSVNDLIRATEFHFNYQGLQFSVSSSYGIAIKADESVTFNDMLGRADCAMYASKGDVENKVTVYDASLDDKFTYLRKIEEALRLSIWSSNDFYILYQPIIDTNTMKLHSVEALARWNSVSLGQIPPDVFIAVAEKSGLIVKLGWLLLKKILTDMQCSKNLRVCINISPLQLMAEDFITKFNLLLNEHSICPTRIEVELTENAFISSCDIIKSKLQELREMGVTTALDDFGTGFSSIGCLQKMPLDTLKIDRSFVSGLEQDETLTKVVQLIVSLGLTLGKSITAEGVETRHQAEILVNSGCNYLQGYLFSRPQPLDLILKNYHHISFSFEPSVQRRAHSLGVQSRHLVDRIDDESVWL